MSTDYEPISKDYADAAETPEALLEVLDIMRDVRPLLRNASVLELGCGSGRYTKHILACDIESLVAVDISETLLETASKTIKTEKVKFRQANCTEPQVFSPARFDVVFAGWLIDAFDRDQLLQMFTLVTMNLKPGGHFFAVTLPMSRDVRKTLQEYAVKQVSKEGIGVLHVDSGETEGGRKINKIYLVDGVPLLSLNQFWLSQDTIESCARSAELTASITWRRQRITLDWLPAPSKQKELWGRTLDSHYVEECRKFPGYSLLTIGDLSN